FADAGLINRSKRIAFDDLGFLVRPKEGTGVVAAHAESGLSEVVCAEAEKLSGMRDFVSGESPTRDFDHGADAVSEFHLFLGLDLLGDFGNDGHLEIEFLFEANQRDHDFRTGLDASLDRVGSSFENGTSLHAGDFRILDAKAAPTEAEHWVELVQFMHAIHDFLDRDAELAREVELLLFGVREELVQGRGEEPDGGGGGLCVPGDGLENLS